MPIRGEAKLLLVLEREPRNPREAALVNLFVLDSSMARLDFFWYSGFECPQEPGSSPLEVQVVVRLAGVGELTLEVGVN